MENRPTEGEKEARIDSPLALMQELCLLAFKFYELTRDIRGRGKYISADLHQLQGEFLRVKRRLQMHVGPTGNLLPNLSEFEKEQEQALVSFVQKDI